MGAEAVGDGGGDCSEGVVSRGVTEVVVDCFEVVDVDEGDAEFLVAGFDALEFEGKLLLDSATVEGSGEEVALQLGPDEREGAAVAHHEEEDAGEADGDQTGCEGKGLDGVALQVVGGGDVEERLDAAGEAHDGGEGHGGGEETCGVSPLGVEEELDGNETAGECDGEGDGHDAGNDVPVHLSEVEDDCDGEEA